MKKTFVLFLATVLSFCMISCTLLSEEDTDNNITENSLEDIYTNSYSTTIRSSSGNTLHPALTIYDDTHLSFDMSSSGGTKMNFYYKAEQLKTNAWELDWYTDSAYTTLSMTALIGIKDTSTIYLEASMGELKMSLVSTGNTWTETEETPSYEDITITVSGDSSSWIEDSSSYTGSFYSIVLGQGFDNGSGTFTVTKTGDSTVSVTVPVSTGMGMTINSYTIENISVTKDGDIYYLSKDSFTANDGTYDITGSSLTGKLEDGVFTLKYVYKPGSMPYDITTILKSGN